MSSFCFSVGYQETKRQAVERVLNNKRREKNGHNQHSGAKVPKKQKNKKK